MKNQMGDAVLSNVEEKIALKNSSSSSVDIHESSVNDSSSLIPTAIVKPKYQKLSFDERQLPLHGATADTEYSTITTTTPRKVQKHLPKSHQKSFAKRKVAPNKGESTPSKHQQSYDLNVTDKTHHTAIDCSVIQQNCAVVQPIKKSQNIINDEKLFDCSKNNFKMNQYDDDDEEEEISVKTKSKFNVSNESSLKSIMSDCGKDNKNNLNYQSDSNRIGSVRENDKKCVASVNDVEMKKKALPTCSSTVKKRNQRDNAGKISCWKFQHAHAYDNENKLCLISIMYA
jgi:hypothetical protein